MIGVHLLLKFVDSPKGALKSRGEVDNRCAIFILFIFPSLLSYGDSSQWLLYLKEAYLFHDFYICVCSGGGCNTGRSLHCQVENHVRTKFATPILYAMDNFKIMIFFLYIHIH